MNKALVTGGSGFIGSNFVRIALENNYCVTGLDSLTYAGQRSTIDHLKRYDKFRFCHDDIGNNDDADASVRLPFEGGWRHECDSSRSGGYLVHATGRRVSFDARFCLQPIP